MCAPVGNEWEVLNPHMHTDATTPHIHTFTQEHMGGEKEAGWRNSCEIYLGI